MCLKIHDMHTKMHEIPKYSLPNIMAQTIEPQTMEPQSNTNTVQEYSTAQLTDPHFSQESLKQHVSLRVQRWLLILPQFCGWCPPTFGLPTLSLRPKSAFSSVASIALSREQNSPKKKKKSSMSLPQADTEAFEKQKRLHFQHPRLITTVPSE